MQIITKKPIAPTLKSLKTNERADFPVNRLSSVRATIQQISCEFEMSFTTRKNNESRMIEVTRIA